jgi:DNA-binding NtrC family response regulator
MAQSILVVDDDAEICRSIGLLLERNGFAVTVANDAPSALRMVIERIPDAMVLDYKLEELSGFWLMVRLQDLGIAAPTVMLTAHPGVREAIRATQLGVLEYLVKPFDHGDLLRIINSVFSSPTTKAPLEDAPNSCFGSSPLLQLREAMGPSRS